MQWKNIFHGWSSSISELHWVCLRGFSIIRDASASFVGYYSREYIRKRKLLSLENNSKQFRLHTTPLWTGLCLWWCLAQIVTALYLALMMADRMTHDDNAESRHQARPHPDNGQITQIMEHSRGQLSLSDDNIITPHQITAATPINIPLSQVSG